MDNKYTPIVENLRAASVEKGRNGCPMTEIELRSEETQLGLLLPSDFREFLQVYAGVQILGTNGGGVAFPLRNSNESGSIYQFFGANNGKCLADTYFRQRANYSLEEGYGFYPGLRFVRDISVPIEIMKWPEELLPIGTDMQANPICLALFGLRPGAIFYWNHTILDDEDNVYLVADSFDEFMHLLYL